MANHIQSNCFLMGQETSSGGTEPKPTVQTTQYVFQQSKYSSNGRWCIFLKDPACFVWYFRFPKKQKLKMPPHMTESQCCTGWHVYLSQSIKTVRVVATLPLHCPCLSIDQWWADVTPSVACAFILLSYFYEPTGLNFLFWRKHGNLRCDNRKTFQRSLINVQPTSILLIMLLYRTDRGLVCKSSSARCVEKLRSCVYFVRSWCCVRKLNN